MEHYTKIDWGSHNPVIIKDYDQTIYTFDIETSSGYLAPGSDTVEPFDYDKGPAYYRDMEKVALCYVWQFGIDDKYYYGRELTEFLEVLDHLDKIPANKYLWVHNLSFEQTFLENIFHPEKVFARKAHSVIYLERRSRYMDQFSTIFRCSYVLTNLPLATWADSIGAPPKLPDYDYDAIRSPLTELTEFEKDYGQRDCEIVYHGIRKFVERYDLLQKIPLTQTAQVRQRILKLYQRDWYYHKKMVRLLPRDAGEYARLRMAFFGGNAHCNPTYVGVKILHAASGDIASSYPFSELTALLPMTPFYECKRGNPMYYLNSDKWCCLVEIELVKCRSNMYLDYISYSKVYEIARRDDQGRRVEDVIVENGKVAYIGYGKMLVTNVDYHIIQESYDGEINVLRLWYSRGGLLHRKYANEILDLYENKTSLKGVPGQEDLYANSKQLLNGTYGDFVTSIVHEEHVLKEDGSWEEIRKGPEEVNAALDELREKPYKLKSSFAWGVWITAESRKNHWSFMRRLDKENHVIYYDTDSVYYMGDHDQDIEEYNKIMTARLDEALKRRGIDPERGRPKDPKGRPRQMGIMEKEHTDIKEFKALRAKCYAFRGEDGVLRTTISGVSKKAGALALKDDIDNFHDDLVFDYKECGKKISNYNTDQSPCFWVDEAGNKYLSTYKHGLNLQPTQYNLSLPQEFYDVLTMLGCLASRWSELSVDDLARIERVYSGPET